jgi:thiol-disulfide isomerase/thioredoxin
VQTGTYADGLKRLEGIAADIKRKSPESPLLAYVAYRQMLADYSTRLQSAEPEKRQEVQKWWLAALEEYIKEYPEGEDTPDAMLQLAITEEFSGRQKEALEWYQKLAKDEATEGAAARAAGAIRRLDLKGKTLNFAGPGLEGGTVDVAKYRGQAVLVLFWATWCQPCTEDLPQLRALYHQYHDQGFEIVGVNLDTTKDPIPAYLTQNRVTWPQMYAPGGLESPPATNFGIISLPTMFLVDAEGKVVNRSITVEDLKTALPDLLPKK